MLTKRAANTWNSFATCIIRIYRLYMLLACVLAINQHYMSRWQPSDQDLCHIHKTGGSHHARKTKQRYVGKSYYWSWISNEKLMIIWFCFKFTNNVYIACATRSLHYMVQGQLLTTITTPFTPTSLQVLLCARDLHAHCPYFMACHLLYV